MGNTLLPEAVGIFEGHARNGRHSVVGFGPAPTAEQSANSTAGIQSALEGLLRGLNAIPRVDDVAAALGCSVSSLSVASETGVLPGTVMYDDISPDERQRYGHGLLKTRIIRVLRRELQVVNLEEDPALVLTTGSLAVNSALELDAAAVTGDFEKSVFDKLSDRVHSDVINRSSVFAIAAAMMVGRGVGEYFQQNPLQGGNFIEPVEVHGFTEARIG